MQQIKLFDIYPMPCPFKIGDKIYNNRFKQSGTIIRIYYNFFEYQLEGTKGIAGVRYSTAADCQSIDEERKRK